MTNSNGGLAETKMETPETSFDVSQDGELSSQSFMMTNGWHLDEDSSNPLNESLKMSGNKKRKLSLDSVGGGSSKKMTKIEQTLLEDGKHGIIDGRWICGECGKSLSSAVGLDQHLSTVHGAYQFPCDICHLMFKRRDHVRNHIRRVHDCKKTCPKCGSQFLGREAYAEHMKTVHKLKVTYRTTTRNRDQGVVRRSIQRNDSPEKKSESFLVNFWHVRKRHFES